MKEKKFEYSVASDIDFEDLIADIGFENNLVALLTQEEGGARRSCRKEQAASKKSGQYYHSYT